MPSPQCPVMVIYPPRFSMRSRLCICLLASIFVTGVSGATPSVKDIFDPTSETSSDPTTARRVAAFVGGLVADAAAMPLHWIYDTAAITSILTASHRLESPEFLPISHAPYYNYPPGEFTPFGEQTMVYAASIADSHLVDPSRIAADYTAYYTKPQNLTRPWISYYDNATKGFLANVRAGKKFPLTGDGDTETNAVAHVLPVVVMQAGRPGFLQDAEAAIRIVQNNDDAVAFGLTFARILEQVILGKSAVDAILHVAAVLRAGTGNPNDAFFAHGLRKMAEWAPRPPKDVTLEIGQGCDFPFHVFTAPHLVLHGAGATTFVEAVRETIKLGGENANRGTFIGSILAAQAGSVEAAIPPEWLKATTQITRVRELALALAQNSSQSSTPFIRAASPRGPTRAPHTLPEDRSPEELQKPHSPTSHLRGTASSHVQPVEKGRAGQSSAVGNTSGASGRPLQRSTGAAPPVVGNSPGCIANSNHTSSNATRPPTHPDDLAGLRALYLATGGPEWARNACWLNASVPVCWWDQVLCNTTTWRVRQLRLASNNLVGTLPSELGRLSQLEDLQVGFNPQLVGAVPEEIGSLKQLRRLYAWNASLTRVPQSFGALEHLVAVDLTDNQLQGALPETLARLQNVDTVYLDGNKGLSCPLMHTVEDWLKGVRYHAEVCKTAVGANRQLGSAVE